MSKMAKYLHNELLDSQEKIEAATEFNKRLLEGKNFE